MRGAKMAETQSLSSGCGFIKLHLDDHPFDVGGISNDASVVAAFEANEESRKRAGKGTALEYPNNPKYTLVDVTSPFHDVTDLVVTFQPTDYFSILRTRPAVATARETRIRFGNLDASRTRIPHAGGIQFSAIFADGSILAIQREKDTFPWPGTWSFSGEEQFSDMDFRWEEERRMEQCLLRTAVEEVFPLARISKKEVLAGAMTYIKPYIRSMQTWSIFFEEPIATFQFFSVFELGLTAAQYSELVSDLVQSGIGIMSPEGKYYSAALSDIQPLLSGTSITVKSLFGEREEQISQTELHPTSRYRLLRLLDCYSG